MLKLLPWTTADPMAIGCIDETGTAKSGYRTTGVKRQHNGDRVKVENCIKVENCVDNVVLDCFSNAGSWDSITLNVEVGGASITICSQRFSASCSAPKRVKPHYQFYIMFYSVMAH